MAMPLVAVYTRTHHKLFLNLKPELLFWSEQRKYFLILSFGAGKNTRFLLPPVALLFSILDEGNEVKPIPAKLQDFE